MARFEDTAGLFGRSNMGTIGEVKCDWCGKVYEDRDPADSDDSASLDVVDFGGLQVVECCFEKLENAVLSRMDDILPWFNRILKAREKRTEDFKRIVEELKKSL